MAYTTSNTNDKMVYWLRVPPTPQPSMQQRSPIHHASTSQTPSPNSPVLYAQHIHTASLLKQYILTPNTSAIFAALRFPWITVLLFTVGVSVSKPMYVLLSPLSLNITSSLYSTCPTIFLNPICHSINATLMMPLCSLLPCWMVNLSCFSLRMPP